MKMRAPKVTRPKKLGAGGRMAFGGGGGVQAFRDPTSMAAPDQAFTAAMGKAPAAAQASPASTAPGQG